MCHLIAHVFWWVISHRFFMQLLGQAAPDLRPQTWRSSGVVTGFSLTRHRTLRMAIYPQRPVRQAASEAWHSAPRKPEVFWGLVVDQKIFCGKAMQPCIDYNLVELFKTCAQHHTFRFASPPVQKRVGHFEKKKKRVPKQAMTWTDLTSRDIKIKRSPVGNGWIVQSSGLVDTPEPGVDRNVGVGHHQHLLSPFVQTNTTVLQDLSSVFCVYIYI